MKMTLQQYNELPELDNSTREKMNDDLVDLIMENREVLKYHIEEMLEYFISDLHNSEFIRLVDTVNAKLSKGE